jgi:tyrosine-protein phosphatase OCA1
MHLFPPQNFVAVEEGIYRSGLPSELNYRFLESLQLRTVIVLSPESMDSLFASFLDDFRIRVIYIQNATNDGFRGLSPVTEETVIEALNVLTDRSNPVSLEYSSRLYIDDYLLNDK